MTCAFAFAFCFRSAKVAALFQSSTIPHRTKKIFSEDDLLVFVPTSFSEPTIFRETFNDKMFLFLDVASLQASNKAKKSRTS